jgi:SAM-dependent methyltransferase
MMSRAQKKVFYLVGSPFLVVSGLFFRYFKAPRDGVVRLHLGPGQQKYMKGWINIDANIFTGRADVWADLRNPLPFWDQTVDAMYSHHMIEHLPNLEFHFKDVYRCLKPGGTYRVGGPNGDSAVVKFIANDSSWFPDFPDKREGIGGKLENFIFCRREHLTILTFSFLDELMRKAGFVDLRICKPAVETYHPEKFHDCLSMEYETDQAMPHTLIIEGVKPL